MRWFSSEKMSRQEWLCLAALVVVGSLYWNWRFITWVATPKILEMNDVAAIVAGYRLAPNLALDGWAWWHGPWIQQGVQVLRPVSSYLLWIESAIGLRWGFFWVGCLGMVLLMANSFLCALLAWRITRWKLGALVAALLTPLLPIFNWRGVTPRYWLAWYPVHHDLLMIGCLLAALLAFDGWLENGARKYLLWTWGTFVLGALSKEFLYIFPLMAFALLLVPRDFRIEPKTALRQSALRQSALRQVALMFAFVVVLYGYRYLVLPDPYNPEPLKLVHLIKRPFLYWLFPFYDTVLLKMWWMPGLALLVLLLGKGLVMWRQSRYAHWLKRPFAGIAVAVAMLAIVAIYNEIFYPGLSNAFWYFSEPSSMGTNVIALCKMIFAWYALYLLWKYRRSEPVWCVVLLVMLAYAPVFTYLGWHYTLTGWFVRTAFLWPLLAKLVAINTGAPLRVAVP